MFNALLLIDVSLLIAINLQFPHFLEKITSHLCCYIYMHKI